MTRKPVPKRGHDLRRTLERIAGDHSPEDVDGQAAARYAGAGEPDHSEVAALARSKSPQARQTARLRAVAMLAGLSGSTATAPMNEPDDAPPQGPTPPLPDED